MSLVESQSTSTQNGVSTKSVKVVGVDAKEFTLTLEKLNLDLKKSLMALITYLLWMWLIKQFVGFMMELQKEK